MVTEFKQTVKYLIMIDEIDIKKLTDVLASKDDVRQILLELDEVKVTVHGLVNVAAGLVTRVEVLN